MSAGTPKTTIPRRIEPRRFAQLGVMLRGDVPVAELTRLLEAGVSASSVTADLVFALGEQREKSVRGRIQASLSLQCQRCLEPVEQVLECDVNLIVVWDQEAAKQASSEYEPWIVSEEEADLYSLVEEEILLNLPLVAYHDYACVDMTQVNAAPETADAGTDTHNPFQVLKQLKDTNQK